MTPLFIMLLIIIGIITGIASGLFGIGGGTVIIPSLILFLGFSQVEAQGTSLAAMLLPVGILGVLRYKKAGIWNYKASLIIALGLFLGGYPGARLALSINVVWLKLFFALFLFYIALRFIEPKKNYNVAKAYFLSKRKSNISSTISNEISFSSATNMKDMGDKQPNDTQTHLISKNRGAALFFSLLSIGLLAGFASGFFGIGGGALIIPLLTFWLHYSDQEARVISLGALDPPVGLLGLIPYIKAGEVSVLTVIPVAISMMGGAFLGALIGVRIPKRFVKMLYGFFLIWVVAYFIYQNMPALQKEITILKNNFACKILI